MRTRFGDFEFDLGTNELWCAQKLVHLQPQPASVLALLLAHPGELVTREAIQNRIWGDSTMVDTEQGLNWCVRRLREVLYDTPGQSLYIQTVPRRGYRFTAEVVDVPSTENHSSRFPLWRRRWLSIAAALSLLAVSTTALVVHRPPSPTPPITILVLPFDNLSDLRGGLPYDDIASAEMTSGLARMDPKRLSVIDPVTARKFKNSKECIIEIGTRLGADYVLLGDVQQSASVVKIDAQLFKVSTNRQVWASEQQIPRNSEFSPVWADMTRSIVSELQLSKS
jgi:DNA-binding winged helix-turn-helix (wHTH) protein/TolB-like protein